MKRKILFVFGTRPEAIKLAPLIIKFKQNNSLFLTKVCVTAQHREMLDQVLNFFNIKVDYDLNIIKPNQSLFDITTTILKNIEKILNKFEPDIIFVQGDTTTAFVGALAGFYKKIKIAHIEAGLRSYNKYAPFPEEINRILINHISDYHFAPTEKAKKNLYNENIKENVWVVGNTVIDALNLGLDIINKGFLKDKIQKFFTSILNKIESRIILVTVHRRETFGETFKQICYAIREIAMSINNIEIVYPVHLNQNVRKPVFEILRDVKNIHLIDPLDYPYLIWIMKNSYLILTDSGGIQEEAPSFGKPVLVMRKVTEREEGIEAGTAKLVGIDRTTIVENVIKLLTDTEKYNNMARAINPYGDGRSTERILKVMREESKRL